MNKVLNRRDLLKGTLGTAALALLPQGVHSASTSFIGQDGNAVEQPKCFLAKHGQPKSDPLFLWSSMVVNDLSRFDEALNRILNDTKYRSQLTYKSSDKYKIAPAKEIIRFIMSDADNTRFDIFLVQSDPDNFKDLPPIDFNKKMDDLYKIVIPDDHGGVIVMKAEDRFGPSDAYVRDFTSTHGVESRAINAKMDKFIQVNDLISGIIFSIFARPNVRSKVKKELNEVLQAELGLSGTSLSTVNNGPFNIRKVTL